MFKKIMVPLDGSELAECVLPHVESFISACQASFIVLVRVVQPAPTLYDDTAAISNVSREKMIENTRRIEDGRKTAATQYLA
ncbi:hypothetical protein ACFLZL_05335 [Thermodesulfobacteriota bacterium]